MGLTNSPPGGALGLQIRQPAPPIDAADAKADGKNYLVLNSNFKGGQLSGYRKTAINVAGASNTGKLTLLNKKVIPASFEVSNQPAQQTGARNRDGNLAANQPLKKIATGGAVAGGLEAQYGHRIQKDVDLHIDLEGANVLYCAGPSNSFVCPVLWIRAEFGAGDDQVVVTQPAIVGTQRSAGNAALLFNINPSSLNFKGKLAKDVILDPENGTQINISLNIAVARAGTLSDANVKIIENLIANLAASGFTTSANPVKNRASANANLPAPFAGSYNVSLESVNSYINIWQPDSGEDSAN